MRYAACLAAVVPMAVWAEGRGPELPTLVPQANAKITTLGHLDAPNECDWERITARYLEEVLFILPNGVTVEGREAIGEVFTGFCQPRARGGFAGATFIPETVRTVGDTVDVSWRMEADWLAEPYRGGDAYVAKDGLMYVQGTTFDPADMRLAD